MIISWRWLFLDTKKFTLIVSLLTAAVCLMTIVYNFASMPAYGDGNAVAQPLYIANSQSSSDFSPSSITSSALSVPESDNSGNAAASSKGTSCTESKSTVTKSPSGLVNINSASLSELNSLPNIGPTRAQAIIDYRNAHGAFKSVDELINVKGIGEATLNKIRQYVTI